MTKEELYKYFGPKLIDAIVQLMIEQLNILRAKARLSEITEQQAIDAIENKLQNISDYDWMKEVI